MWDEISIEVEGEDMIQKYAILNWLQDNGEPYQVNLSQVTIEIYRWRDFLLNSLHVFMR